jgi:ATP-dependent exoDNAse (exonuclease V) beta subunit
MTTHVFDQITFDETAHRYTLNGEELTGVSRVLGTIKPPFDAPTIAARSAAKSGRSVESILAEWDAKKEASLALGTRVHGHIERVLAGQGAQDAADPFLALNQDRSLPEEEAFDAFWQRIGSRLQLHRAEWIIGDEALKVAGRLDALFFSPETGQYHLWDWKTGKCDDSNRWENLLPPFSDLPNCAVSIYSLQASLYRLILERNTDLELGDSYLLHLQSTGQFRVIKVGDHRARLLGWLGG